MSTNEKKPTDKNAIDRREFMEKAAKTTFAAAPAAAVLLSASAQPAWAGYTTPAPPTQTTPTPAVTS